MNLTPLLIHTGKRMKQILFFATHSDLLKIMSEVEAKTSVRYTKTGNFTSRQFDVYDRGSDIPGLGIADSTTGASCSAFLVCNEDAAVNVLELDGTGGQKRFLVDQRSSRDGVTLTPAGRLSADVILNGRVTTSGESTAALNLMGLFRGAIRKHFKKMGAYWVGSEALASLRSGGRLTISVQSPKEFDLVE